MIVQNWAPILIASIALLVSIISLVINWRHSESLFRRREYPAVAWRMPKLTREDNNTAIVTSVCNKGPRDVASIFLGVFLCRGLSVKAWCKSESIEGIPIGEELDFIITKELEKDINDRFPDLFYDGAWRFKRKPKRYKVNCRLEYLPHIADTPYYTRKTYYLLTPVTEGNLVVSWELRSVPEWQGWLPWF